MALGKSSSTIPRPARRARTDRAAASAMTSQRSRKLRLHIFGSKVHKWLAVFVGVQALLWMATGTIMSFLKIEHVRSEHVISREPLPLGASNINFSIIITITSDIFS